MFTRLRPRLELLRLHPLLGRPTPPATAWERIGWWEVRRVPWNLVVGAFGILSGLVAICCAGVSESLGGEPVGMPDGIFVLVVPVIVAAVANLCYTGGWVTELVIARLWPRQVDSFAPLAFAAGTLFSVAAALAPALLAAAYLVTTVSSPK